MKEIDKRIKLYTIFIIVYSIIMIILIIAWIYCKIKGY